MYIRIYTYIHIHIYIHIYISLVTCLGTTSSVAAASPIKSALGIVKLAVLAPDVPEGGPARRARSVSGYWRSERHEEPSMMQPTTYEVGNDSFFHRAVFTLTQPRLNRLII